MAGHVETVGGKPKWRSDPADLGAEGTNARFTVRLVKPFSAEELMRAVERAVRGSGARRL